MYLTFVPVGLMSLKQVMDVTEKFIFIPLNILWHERRNCQNRLRDGKIIKEVVLQKSSENVFKL